MLNKGTIKRNKEWSTIKQSLKHGHGNMGL
jgi:hypothetical protein